MFLRMSKKTHEVADCLKETTLMCLCESAVEFACLHALRSAAGSKNRGQEETVTDDASCSYLYS